MKSNLYLSSGFGLLHLRRVTQLLLAVSVVLGMYFRFHGLGVSPLSVDEYYFTKSVLNILDKGLPQYAAGGEYYTRGLLQQYLTAGLIAAGLSMEWAARFIPLLANLICIPAIFLLGKRLGGAYVACIAVVLFSLSLWEIEFSRFARMYAAFQTVFVWYVYYLTRAYFDGDRRSLPIAYALSLFSIVVYEGAPIILVLNFIPIFSQYARRNLAIFLIPVAIIGIYFGYNQLLVVDVTPRIDPSLVSHPAVDDGLGFVRPSLLVGYVFNSVLWLGLFLLLAVLACCSIRKILRQGEVFQLWSLLMMTSVFLAVFNQMGFSLVCVVVGLLFHSAGGRNFQEHWSVFVLPISVIFLLGVFWVTFGLLNREWYGDVSNLDITLHPAVMTQLGSVLVDFPGMISRFLIPWLRAMPINTAIILFATFGVLLLAIIRAKAVSDDVRLVVAISVAGVLFVSELDTVQRTTRYAFFIFPLFLIILSYGIYVLASCITASGDKRAIFSLAGVASIIFISDDYSFYHLINIDKPEIMYREVYPLKTKNHFYPRRDFFSPAEFVNQNRRDGDLVVSEVTVVDIYLESPINYMYLPVDEAKFWQRSVLGSQKDRWTGANLIYRGRAIETLASNVNARVWLIVFAVDWFDRPVSRYRSEYPAEKVYTSSDGTIDVFLLNRDAY